MEYYKLFSLEREPFSNTPDPDFFFRSSRHVECLQKLELGVYLRRGLCVVSGEVGSGKTTLCRQLIRALSHDDSIEVHLVLHPGFDRPERLASELNRMLNGREKTLTCSTMGEHKEMIKNYLFEAGVEQGKTVVLIIDEGQKLSGPCVEFLRELLNYETNQHKLLHMVIFGQKEIDALLAAHPNFADRVALYYHLGPLNRRDTAAFVRFRLETAGYGTKSKSSPVFTRGALNRICALSGGYPRRIINLAHASLLLMLVKGTNRARPSIVDQAARSLPSNASIARSGGGDRRLPGRPLWAAAGLAAVLITVCVLYLFGPLSVQSKEFQAIHPQRFKIPSWSEAFTAPEEHAGLVKGAAEEESVREGL